MNYSRKKSDGIFKNFLSSLLKVCMVLSASFIFCTSWDIIGGTDSLAVVTVEIPDRIVQQNDDTSSVPVCTESNDLFIQPVIGPLTSPFGERWGRNHNGIDIGADINTEIYAADDGEVVFSGVQDGYGNYISILHDNGIETSYAHCNSLAVIQGDYVTKGQVIAYVGSTGNSTGPHLHFEVKVNGEYQNPLNYVIY